MVISLMRESEFPDTNNLYINGIQSWLRKRQSPQCRQVPPIFQQEKSSKFPPPLALVNPPPRKSKKKAAVPIQQPETSSETSTASTNKNQTICFHHTTSLNPPSQEPSASSSEAVYWEPYPYLTDHLLAWLLERPADRAVLFYDKSSGESSSISTNARATGHHKKDIYPIIAKELFEKDATYSSAYASQPDKFASAVQSRLSTLKTKYRAQCNRFKATGAGVKPGDPAYQNLKSFITENVLQAFPHFEDCDALWRGIPSYNTRPFDSAPSTNWTSDFLSMIHCGAATTPSRRPTVQDIHNCQDAPEVQDQMNEDICADTNMLDDGGKPADAEGHQPISWDIDPETGDILYRNCDVMMEDGEEGPVDEFNYQAEQEEGGREYEPEGAQTQMPVNANPLPGDLHRGKYHVIVFYSYYSYFTNEHLQFPNTVGPKPPPFGVSQGSTKGRTRSTLDQMKNDLRERLDDFDAGSQDQKLSSGVLRNERYSMKMQAWMRDKEITFLEAQQVTKHAEAEAIHRRQLEVKKTNLELRKADAEVLEKQSQVLMLQLHLAEFEKQGNHGLGADPSSTLSGTDASSGSGYV
ncbi:hypothetical protein PAXINDRAFT_157369 [Paxillus involutus ATCC 200175]|uniref:Uncharacterized protein n=1 Tax=Paxillus involutus ATCC 200175 TaxID=664439 RepID=A0A0C9TTV9_PAXIN|nr:hypothetical protein PAXINDRAFT_157369 [Paxillus involutus ATCC 200175]